MLCIFLYLLLKKEAVLFYYCIFEEFNNLHNLDKNYSSERKRINKKRVTIIDTSSTIAQIIADASKEGYSKHQAVVIANKYL